MTEPEMIERVVAAMQEASYVVGLTYEQERRHIAQAAIEAVRRTDDEALQAAIRAAELALFVIRKQGVMPNSSWEDGFNNDLAIAKASLKQ